MAREQTSSAPEASSRFLLFPGPSFEHYLSAGYSPFR